MDVELQAITRMCQTALFAVWERLLRTFTRGSLWMVLLDAKFGGTRVRHQAFAARQCRRYLAEYGGTLRGTANQTGALLKIVNPERG